MIALHNNIPYVTKTIKRLFLPHDFGGKIEIDCFKKKHSTSVELEPEGYFLREIMMVHRKMISITEKENLKKEVLKCSENVSKRSTPFHFT